MHVGFNHEVKKSTDPGHGQRSIDGSLYLARIFQAGSGRALSDLLSLPLVGDGLRILKAQLLHFLVKCRAIDA